MVYIPSRVLKDCLWKNWWMFLTFGGRDMETESVAETKEFTLANVSWVWCTTSIWNMVHEVFLEKKLAADAIFKLLHQLSQEFTCHQEDWYAANVTIPAASRNNTSTNSVRNDHMTTTTPVRHSGSGIGICIRDDEGTFMLAKTVYISPMCSVVVGEALGLFQSLQWLSDMQFDNVDFTLDSKITTDAFNHRRIDVTEFIQVISSC
ncbi:hypothetical protein MTR_0093s0070 [Medicago truncatula]|uniref:RNase H type-1 domain-containing protein n=1 Tax=Medicago truncatula TaxID=3880 RepID=A0A072TTB6_MEDTR|nr:hypothetical protein MTR_0093s0070 [Medicago truncatula]